MAGRWKVANAPTIPLPEATSAAKFALGRGWLRSPLEDTGWVPDDHVLEMIVFLRGRYMLKALRVQLEAMGR